MRYVSIGICLGIVLLCWIGPLLRPVDPMLTHPEAQFQPPGIEYWLGTDFLGRDVLSRTLYGGQRSLLMGGVITFIVVCVGLSVGVIAGMIATSRWQHLLLVVINALLSVPGLVISLVVLTIMGSGMLNVIVAVSLAQFAPFVMVVRAAVIQVNAAQYIDAAYALGATHRHVVMQHILRGVSSHVIAYTGVVFAYALMNAAALTFLGFGDDPAIPDWGVILAQGRSAFRVAPWIALAPGIALTLMVWSVNRFMDHVVVGRLRI